MRGAFFRYNAIVSVLAGIFRVIVLSASTQSRAHTRTGGPLHEIRTVGHDGDDNFEGGIKTSGDRVRPDPTETRISLTLDSNGNAV